MTTPQQHDDQHFHLGRCCCMCPECYDRSGNADDNDGCICLECSC